MEPEDKKKLRLGLGCSLLILVLLLSGREDRFQKVLDQHDEDTGERLKTFRKGGIENKIEKENYHAEVVIENAFSYLGTPHCMAGTSTKGIDCSGLVMVAHRASGIELPHFAEEQARFGKIIYSIKFLERGDLVFFHRTYSTSKLITHSGIYLGEGKFIHASSSKGVVVSEIESDYYLEHFIFATRL